MNIFFMKTARDIMSSRIITMELDVTPIEIAKIMNKNNVGSIIITKDQKPFGIITEHDIISKIVAQNKLPSETKTMDVLTAPLVVVSPLTPVDEIAEKMMLKKIRRIVVMDKDQAVGIVTVTDFVKNLHSMLTDSENYDRDLYQGIIEDWEHWTS